MDDIQKYRKHKSHQISKTSRWAILFDIAYKFIILSELIYLMIFLKYQNPYQIVIGILMLITLFLILTEFNFLRKLKLIRETDAVIENIKNKLQYLKTTYRKFIFLSALSNTLFVLSCFFLYYHFKYNEIKLGTPIEDPVLYLILIAAFAVSLFGQIPVYNSQIKELQEILQDIDDDALIPGKIAEARKRRRTYIIIFSVLILLGVLFLLITTLR